MDGLDSLISVIRYMERRGVRILIRNWKVPGLDMGFTQCCCYDSDRDLVVLTPLCWDVLGYDFVVSALIHELGHVLARRRGLNYRDEVLAWKLGIKATKYHPTDIYLHMAFSLATYFGGSPIYVPLPDGRFMVSHDSAEGDLPTR